MAKKRQLTPRYSREDWLHKALEVLAAKGPSQLNIGALCKALGVTRGSFYWHFEDRKDFIHELLELWHEEYTARMPEFIEEGGGTGREKLQRLI